MVGVEESSVNSHLEHLVGGNLSVGLHLGVVGGDPSEFLDCNVGSIFDEVLVGINIDSSVNKSFNGCDDVWDNSALQEWDEDTGNSGDKSTGKGNINIGWVNNDVRFLHFKVWSFFGSNSLFTDVTFKINGKLVDFNGDLTGDGDPVFVRESGGDGGLSTVGEEFNTV